MNKKLRWKIIFLALITIFSITSIVPSFNKSVPDWWKTYLAPVGLKLGLDLQGGMHLILKVNLAKAIDNSLDFAAQDLKEALQEKHISVVKTASPNKGKLIFTVPNKSAINTIKSVVKDEFPNLNIKVEDEAGSFPRIIMRLTKKRVQFIKKNAVNQSLEIIRNRIDQFGVSEPVIVRQGSDEIVVQLPGIKDPKRALKLIGQTAQLEFKMVVENNGGLNLNSLINQAIQSGQWQRGESLSKLNQALARQLPPDTEVYFETNTDSQTGIKTKSPLLVKSQVMMSGDMIADAQVRVGGSFNEPYCTLDLTGRGGKKFAEITSKNVNKRFAIILDGKVKSAPVIREKILGGRAQISGNFTYEEASDLAIVLRIGALPAPVEIVQNLTVGASLGKDSIHKGVASGLLGVALVVIFMLVYYRFSGLIANCALMLNVLLVFAGLAFMNATLTLPGIAGIILSIGMAVDSNVLIFERMREEFALGKSVRAGVEGGYSKAFWTIVDSQVTTLITALALFLFGTGPIKGFAVTLSFGVTFNLFTTLFGTKIVYDYLYGKRALKKLTFMKFLDKPNFDYMKIRKITFTVSTILALLGVVAFVQILRGQANLGVDFAGGSMLEYQAAKPFTLKEARAALTKHGLGGVQLQKVEGSNQLIIKLKKSTKTVENLDKGVTIALNAELSKDQFKIISETEIGSSISSDLRNKAILAIFISLFGIIFYLALRFDIRFGLAGVIAIFHDVLVVLGICYIMNVEITLLLVTALLTLAGYSINDSVVVFDRIRENLKRQGHEKNFIALINRSTNEMLARTLVTSMTTVLSLVAIFFLGGVVLHDFAFALIIGIIVGTYSSVFIASPLLYVWSKEKQV
ncbi:MAG: protein translocase subunit SecD [Deltaproteobacteria bacterium]|nr:protein translocase subunit SecD [Deltaproteobacteria bacterium]